VLIPGFVSRLREEVIALVDQEEHFKGMQETINENLTFNDIDYPANLISWAGGKLYNTLIVEEKEHSINLESLTKDPAHVEKIYDQFYII
jgi:hypothetical protein